MSRIADKHGLTNQYREAGIGKRVVKRGRPRKYLFSPSNRKSKNNNIVVSNKTEMVILISVFLIFILAFFSLVPIFRCMLPVVIGALLLCFVNAILNYIFINKKGKAKAPVPVAWMIITAIEMIVSFFIVLLVQIGEIPNIILIGNIIFYIILSVVMLYRKIKQSTLNDALSQPIEKI